MSAADKALSKLQRLVRSERASATKPEYFERHRGGVIPDDLVALVEQRQEFYGAWLTLSGGEYDALLDAEFAVEQDERFEHLDERMHRGTQNAVWRFACEAYLRPDVDLVPEFVQKHAREVVERTCYFRVDYLSVSDPFELAGALVLPASDPRVPDHKELRGELGSAIAVPTRGTSGRKMMERARPTAEHVVRVMRQGLRQHRMLDADQLRFELAQFWAFDGTGLSWQRGIAPIEMTLTKEMLPLVLDQEIARIDETTPRDIRRRAMKALRHLDDARLATTAIARALDLFMALEALLGDGDGGLKSCRLALRRAVLAELMGSGTVHPSLLEALYERVRSRETHGSEPDPITGSDLGSLDYSIRTALDEFIAFAKERGLTRRHDVNAALLTDPTARRWLSELQSKWLPAHLLGKPQSNWDRFELPRRRVESTSS